MRATLQLLRGIQTLDRDLFQVRTELKRLPKERDKRRARIDALGHEKAEAERGALDLRGRIKEIEDITTTQRQRIRKLEGEAANSRADAALLAAFQHEIRTLRREIGEAEEEGLGLVEQADAFTKRMDELGALISSEEADFAEYNGNIEAELAAAQEKADGLASERNQKLSGEGLSPDILLQYEKLLDAREGQAMALLESKICQGCYTSVPSNVYVRLARGTDLVTCPSCGRILYLPD
ncbi:MAG: C4-type zinc ribbon domain-containing protein [Planctomycetota bacterium]